MIPALYRTLRLFWPGGLETRRNLNQLRQTQWLTREELDALQLRRVQALVRHAYQNVPFYRHLYQQAGIHPDDIQSLDDFTRLPIISRDDIDNHLDQFIDQTFPRDRLVPVETGGSTGRPLRFYVTHSFWWQNAANWFRVREWHGVQEGEKMAWFWGAAQDMPTWSWRRRLRSILMQERYLNAFDVSEEAMHRFARLLTRWKPAMLKGYPSVVELFARFVLQHGYDQIRPRLIETTSEKLTQPQRDLLSEAFPGAVVVDHYSSREMGTIAYQCETGEMLVCADVRLLEIIANGQPAPPGKPGEIVLTSLTQYAMPFIRYKNDDIGIWQAGESRSGRSFPVLKEIVGRSNDLLVTPDGKFVYGGFFSALFRSKPEVVRFQVYQPEPARLIIRLVCQHPLDTAWQEQVRQKIQAQFGPAVQITLEQVDRIELTPAGKHRYVISEVTANL